MSALIDLSGCKFGSWLCLEHVARRGGRSMIMCRCDCGTERLVAAQSLRIGRSTSCGCAKPGKIAVARTRHGQGGGLGKRESAMYMLWKGMVSRCSPRAAQRQPYHAGKGVKVCARWQTFENFFADVGQRPAGMTLDRYPNTDGDYEPSNVRWATPREQRANQRRTA